MKVVEVISDTNIGGAGVLLINRLLNTDMSVYDTTVILPNSSMLEDRFRKIGVKCISVPCKGDRSFELGAVWKYISIFKIIFFN